MESVRIILLDRRFRILWSSAYPQNDPFVGKPLFDLTPDAEMLKEKFTNLMLGDPIEEFVANWKIYQPPDFDSFQITAMCAKLIRVDDIQTVAAVGIFREADMPPGLAEQDQEILRLLTQDLTLVEIADRMGRAISTIEYRTKRLKEAFGVKTLPGLAAESVRRGAIRRKDNRQARPAVQRRA